MTFRRVAGLTTALLMMVALVPLIAVPALGEHIPETGTVPANCVEFQAGNTGTKTVSGVSITVDSWDSGDPHEVEFTISGLDDDEYVDISVKSGNNVQEDGPYGNGTFKFDNGLQNAISHIRLCVFEEETTTTTEAETTTTTEAETTTTTEAETTTTTEAETTTTTEQESTTTTEAETTTTTEAETTTTTEVEATTTTEPETTTTTEEVLGETTTTTEEVLGETTSTTEVDAEEEATSTTEDDETEDTLPFTGIGTDGIALAALIALASGAGLVFLTRRSAESKTEG